MRERSPKRERLGAFADHVRGFGRPQSDRGAVLVRRYVLGEHRHRHERFTESLLVHPTPGSRRRVSAIQPHVTPHAVLTAPADRGTTLVPAGALSNHPQPIYPSLDGVLLLLVLPVPPADHVDLAGERIQARPLGLVQKRQLVSDGGLVDSDLGERRLLGFCPFRLVRVQSQHTDVGHSDLVRGAHQAASSSSSWVVSWGGTGAGICGSLRPATTYGVPSFLDCRFAMVTPR